LLFLVGKRTLGEQSKKFPVSREKQGISLGGENREFAMAPTRAGPPGVAAPPGLSLECRNAPEHYRFKEANAMQARDYGPFPYTPINARPKLEWPGGARLAIWIIPNIEFFPLSRGIAPHPGAPVGNPPSVRPWAQRDYGNRVGIWRLMDVLSKHGIRASPTLNNDICDHHPQIVRAAIELGWEILGHNRTNSVWLDQLSPEEERKTISQTLSRIAEITGPQAGRLARLRTRRDLAHAGLSRRRRLSLCRRLGQRPPALFHGHSRQAPCLNSVF